MIIIVDILAFCYFTFLVNCYFFIYIYTCWSLLIGGRGLAKNKWKVLKCLPPELDLNKDSLAVLKYQARYREGCQWNGTTSVVVHQVSQGITGFLFKDGLRRVGMFSLQKVVLRIADDLVVLKCRSQSWEIAVILFSLVLEWKVKYSRVKWNQGKMHQVRSVWP